MCLEVRNKGIKHMTIRGVSDEVEGGWWLISHVIVNSQPAGDTIEHLSLSAQIQDISDAR